MYYFKTNDSIGGVKTEDERVAQTLEKLGLFVACTAQEYAAAMERYEQSYNALEEADKLRTCTRCGQYKTTNGDGICWHCKEQETIDRVG